MQPRADDAGRAHEHGTHRRPERRRWRRLAIAGITVQFLALVRTLAEVYRLRSTRGPGIALDVVMPYVGGGIVAAVCCWLAVTLFFLRRYEAVAGVAICTVALLLLYKFVFASG
jgi:hypothetical protein